MKRTAARRTAPARVHGHDAVTVVLLALAATMLAGCLGEPEIEDRWTRVDIVSSSATPYQSVTQGTAQAFSVQTAITYRSIITGFAVTELRATTAIPATSVNVHPDADREPMAYAIDAILQNSVTMGRAARAVTGWNHLIQRLDMSFTGWIPSSIDSSGTPPSLFLVTYLADGVEIELADGSDSLVVTPFPSAQYEILPVGMTLAPTSSGPTP